MSLPVSVGESAVSIIQNMIGSPPDYHMIMDICDFLLNVHPAAKTYISHSRSGFYFNLSWGEYDIYFNPCRAIGLDRLIF